MPLSKLFQKRSSVKDKTKTGAGSGTNEASTSVQCAQNPNENKDSSSTEHLPPTPGAVVTSAFSDSEEKIERPPSITAKDSNSESRTEDSLITSKVEESSKAECIMEVPNNCQSVDISVENCTAAKSLASSPDALLDITNDQGDVVDSCIIRPIAVDTAKMNIPEGNIDTNSTTIKTPLPTDEEIIRGLCGPKKETSSTDGSTTVESPIAMAEGIHGVFCDSKDSIEVTTVPEETTDESCDFKKNVDIGSSLTQGDSKTEKIENSFTPEVLKDEINTSPEMAQKQKDEPVLNSEETGSTIRMSTHPENNGSSSVEREVGTSNVANSEKIPKKKTRSSSLEDSGSKPLLVHSKNRRRKCESESATMTSADDVRRQSLELQKRDLKEVIEKCVDKLLRESIAVAVSKVDVEGLCDEVIKTMADRSQSESSSSSSDCHGDVEQKLHSNSVKDYADLEMLETFEDSLEASEEETPADENTEGKLVKGIASADSLEISDTVEVEKENVVEDVEDPRSEVADGTEFDNSKQDEANGDTFKLREDKDLDGYSGDLEESVSIHSFTKETIDGNGNLLSTNETCDEENVKNKEDSGTKHEKIEENPSQNTATEVSNPSVGNTEIEAASKPSEISNHGVGMLRVESEDLLTMSDESELMNGSDQTDVTEEHCPDIDQNVPQQDPQQSDEGKKVNWKMGYLQVKMPPKSRGKGHLNLKAWKKRCVAVHQDEFANDPNDPWLMISVYSGSNRHTASFWKSVSCRKAVVYRSSSSSQRYAFTIADDGKPLLHLAAESEAQAQEWMAAVRAVLWPPSPVVQLEKMLNGSQFEVSLIDNDFSYRAGLLGMYGHLTITPKKLILVHPQQGYVIQEWYLNTVDKFELMHQPKIEDVHKVLCMTTCSDSSTGQGEILIFCREAVALLQSLASTIHQILTHHSRAEGQPGRYAKELEEMAEWLIGPAATAGAAEAQEEYYKVPPRQVRSLLDIPNFIFDKPLSPVASETKMDPVKSQPLTESTARGSKDSGISAGGSSSVDDFLNCSTTSFVVGGASGKSSDSELSDSQYTPPVSPAAKVRSRDDEVVQKTVN